ncbi:MAG: hypothetical protein R3F59_11930 [Myxococcota bacterium]
MAETQASDEGKMWAALSYGSYFMGLPLGIIPLLQRDNAFALRHARTATAVYLVTLISFFVLNVVFTIVAFVTCGFGGLLYPVAFLPVLWGLIVNVHGLILAINGDDSEPIGAFGIGELMFGSVQLKETASIPDSGGDRPPPPPPTAPPEG